MLIPYTYKRKERNPMGLTYITVTLKDFKSGKTYTGEFLVDTGATDSMVSASKLRELGIEPLGHSAYQLADGSQEEFPFALAEFSFMDEITAGRVLFGPDDTEPLLGVTVLESAQVMVDPVNQTIKRLPAGYLK
jgi:clan AA aspartic protease